MNRVYEDIEFKFYEVLKHKFDIKEFEQWVYQTKELESELPEEIYTDLISINYKDKYVHNELENIIEDFVDNGKFEIKRIKKFLKSIIDKDENCAESIEITYDLYCSGYAFLRRLGLTYGLLVSCPPAGNYQKSWDEITKAEQNELLEKLYPTIIQDAQNVLNWFNENKIIIKDTINELGYYEYDDLRNQEEIDQGEIEVIDLDKQKKKKWKFWK
ncbi:hypothetical protein V6R21_00475 [Limibacter armeniacum]|uniref:hypothetical protein n=1 Tax=Limibacter armeniacum TaxID=466084 RepID=UPI002FE6953C